MIKKYIATAENWKDIFFDHDFHASIFRTLPRETFLNLRLCDRPWRDLPLFHMIERCVSPPMSSRSPDIAQLKDDFSLLQFFHKKHCHNQQLFNTQLAILNKDVASVLKAAERLTIESCVARDSNLLSDGRYL